MIKHVIFTLLAALCVSRAAVAAPAIHLVYVDPPGSAIDAGGQAFKRAVESRSHGAMHVQLCPDGGWPTPHQDELGILGNVRSGQTEMCIVTTAPLANYSRPFEVLDAPFLFSDYRQVDTTLDGAVGRDLLSDLDKSGLHGLVFMDSGFRIFTSNRPLSGLSDFRKLRVRVMQNEIYTSFIELLGATPIPSAVTKINEMAARGYIDAADRSYPTYFEFHLDQVQKYVLESNHAYAAEAMVINEAFYRRLSAQQQQIVLAAARKARDVQRRRFRDLSRQVKAACGRDGIAITYLSAADRDKMRAACAPIYERLKAQFGPLMAQLLTHS